MVANSSSVLPPIPLHSIPTDLDGCRCRCCLQLTLSRLPLFLLLAMALVKLGKALLGSSKLGVGSFQLCSSTTTALASYVGSILSKCRETGCKLALLGKGGCLSHSDVIDKK